MTIYVPGNLILANEPFRAITATGGDSVFDIAQNGIRYRVHVFTTVGNSTFTVTDPGSGLHPGIGGRTLNSVEYLVIAGGGGATLNTGGGAGGYRCSVVGELSGGNSSAEAPIIVTAQAYQIVVGNRGFGAGFADSQNGHNSSAFGIVALGGGGSGVSKAGFSGGSSGGSWNGTLATPGTTGQGSAGGSGGPIGSPYAGGGGGGAGAAGGSANISVPGIGGNGLTSSITGIAITRAGGGAGASHTTGTAAGGTGGGGSTGQAGSANTGGGGGAKTGTVGTGYAGGSGIVIVRYAI